MRIFVTGGTGFVGSPLVRLLANHGHDVLILTRSQDGRGVFRTGGITYLQGDLSSLDSAGSAIMQFRPEAFVHLAWEGLPDYSLEMSRRNLDYSLEVFLLAAKTGCSCIVSTGSCWEYAGKNGMLSEHSDLESKSIFPAVKNGIRFIGEAMASSNGIRFFWLRLFFVYGPGQRRTSLIPSVIESIKNDRVPPIQNPHNKNDFVYVEDVATAIAGIVEEQPANTVYNVGSGSSRSVFEVIRTTCKVMGKDFDSDEYKHSPEGGKEDFWADVSQLTKDIGWKPAYDLESGIRTTVGSMTLGE